MKADDEKHKNKHVRWLVWTNNPKHNEISTQKHLNFWSVSKAPSWWNAKIVRIWVSQIRAYLGVSISKVLQIHNFNTILIFWTGIWTSMAIGAWPPWPLPVPNISTPFGQNHDHALYSTALTIDLHNTQIHLTNNYDMKIKLWGYTKLRTKIQTWFKPPHQ